MSLNSLHKLSESQHAVILAGGKSLRFGRDKAWAEYRGVPLIVQLSRTLESAGFSISISGNDKRLKELAYPVIADEYPGEGPLCALHSVLRAVQSEHVLLVACDMPFPEMNLLIEMWRQRNASPLVWLKQQGQISPLPGVYAARLLSRIAAFVARGRRDLKVFMEGEEPPHLIPASHWRKFDPMGTTLRNINYEGDLPP
jgi:molybdopterin-guanine dinucleotide biosynthesis protein A